MQRSPGAHARTRARAPAAVRRRQRSCTAALGAARMPGRGCGRFGWRQDSLSLLKSSACQSPHPSHRRVSVWAGAPHRARVNGGGEAARRAAPQSAGRGLLRGRPAPSAPRAAPHMPAHRLTPRTAQPTPPPHPTVEPGPTWNALTRANMAAVWAAFQIRGATTNSSIYYKTKDLPRRGVAAGQRKSRCASRRSVGLLLQDVCGAPARKRRTRDAAGQCVTVTAAARSREVGRLPSAVVCAACARLRPRPAHAAGQEGLQRHANGVRAVAGWTPSTSSGSTTSSPSSSR